MAVFWGAGIGAQWATTWIVGSEGAEPEMWPLRLLRPSLAAAPYVFAAGVCIVLGLLLSSRHEKTVGNDVEG